MDEIGEIKLSFESMASYDFNMKNKQVLLHSENRIGRGFDSTTFKWL